MGAITCSWPTFTAVPSHATCSPAISAEPTAAAAVSIITVNIRRVRDRRTAGTYDARAPAGTGLIGGMRVERSVLAPALSLALAVGIFGVSFGVLAASAGLSLPQASAMSLLVFTGSAQYAAVAAAAAGAAMPAVVLTGLLLNTRCVAFGVALAPVIGGRWSHRLLGAQLIIDESTALAMAEEDPARARAAFWMTGLAVFGCWNAATVAGALAQSALGDPRRLGLDAVFPAAFVALLVPMVRRRSHLAAALAGAAVAVSAVPFAPAGVPITLGALGALAGVAAERRA